VKETVILVVAVAALFAVNDRFLRLF